MRVAVEDVKKHIIVENLPRTALVADIRRTLRRERVVGVDDVQIDLYRFSSNRRAYLTLSHPDFLQQNIAKLEKASVGGFLVTAHPTDVPPVNSELRGVKGRQLAAKRGAITGTGPSGCVPSNGRHVCIWGLPPKISSDSIKEHLQKFGLTKLDDKTEIYQVPLPENAFSLFSRHLLRTQSLSDSYHIVRRIHMTYFQPEVFGRKFQVHACVVR
ncbi:hypothetical protein M404DRAFT_952973 [Pisolithus tinctorius Marx 270]|uniref:RRM domain-containing protein n=1 Tax=Pisolithus tinctorius Marx 270 TaxID=870435 RepID=A0A0C3PW99_PISTI|nr:hypothetical protein M404DRAFT_952973 [Pisolithus tinctorius Marx 270]